MATQSLTPSQNSVSTQKPTTSVGFRRPDAVTVTEATDYAGMLMGSFAQKDVGNPKIFAAGLVQIMSLYPAYVLADVISPSIGLPSKSKFMPALAEVKAACEEAAISHAMAQRAMEPPKPDRAAETTPEHQERMKQRFASLMADLAKGRAGSALEDHP